MPLNAIGSYLEKLPIRIIELKMAIADAASVPHMKEKARKSITREWMQMINQGKPPAQTVSPARLKLLGLNVKRTNVLPNTGNE